MSYREMLVYTGVGKLAHRMSDYAAHLASTLKSRLAGLVVEAADIDISEVERVFAGAEAAGTFIRLVEQRRERHDAVLRAGSAFEETMKSLGVPHDTLFKTCAPADIPDVTATIARLYDCAILPSVEEQRGLGITVLEEVLFSSGRPMIVVPVDGNIPSSLDVVLVAWDGSRAATRTVHDAIPILRQATRVEIITITEEKSLHRLPTGQDLVQHLRAHDVNAGHGEVGFNSQPIGEQIMHEALQLDAKLLIMGAYGHSRIKQIVLGGATRSVLSAPVLPVLMSH
jgi:nucleotide-binding universal stress UspA family protein